MYVKCYKQDMQFIIIMCNLLHVKAELNFVYEQICLSGAHVVAQEVTHIILKYRAFFSGWLK